MWQLYRNCQATGQLVVVTQTNDKPSHEQIADLKTINSQTADIKQNLLDLFREVRVNASKLIKGAFMHAYTFFTEEQLAARWNITKRTLQKWRATGLGPHHTKLGRKILYSSTAVEIYENPPRTRCISACTNDLGLCNTEKF
jgi:site-specific DNA-adenine methylase